MANIAPLPSAAALLTKGGPTSPGKRPAYGPHCTVTVDPSIAALLDSSAHVLATVRLDGTFEVHFDRLDPETVPYVNKFIASTGKRVERYWRTKSYRFVPAAPSATPAPRPVAPVRAPKVRPIAPVAPIETAHPVEAVVPLTEPEPERVEVTATLHVPVSSSHLGDEVIPGLGVLPKVEVKAGTKGWTRVGNIVIPDAAYRTLQDAWELRKVGKVAAVLITGPSGTAKSVLVRSFAASLGVPFLKVDGGSIRTADDWAGAFRQDAATETWAYRWSAFAQTLKAGRPAIILVDELTRTETTQALNALLGLLDESGTLQVPDANGLLTMPAGILLVATANIGPEFVGTLPIDGAVRRRFPYGIRLAYPPEPVEVAVVTQLSGCDKALATRLVKMADMQRLNREDPQQYPSGNVISTGVVLDIARRIVLQGTDPREAVVSTLYGQFDPGDDKAISVCIDTQFPAAVEVAVAGVEVSETAANAEPPALIVMGKHYFSSSYTGLCGFSTAGLAGVCGKNRYDPIHL